MGRAQRNPSCASLRHGSRWVSQALDPSYQESNRRWGSLCRDPSHKSKRRMPMLHNNLYRSLAGALAVAAALVMTLADARAHDASKYPAFEGQWKRKLGTVNAWDESRRPGLPQDPPLTPEYRKIWEASMADQAAGGQGLDTRVTCISNGMPRMMTILRQLEIFITPWVTLVVFENNLPRRIYTDGRDWSAKDNRPSYNGYSIGKWIDEDGDGRYDVLEVETRNFKGPRNYEPSGIPLHEDYESVIKERMYIAKDNPDTLVNEITTFDHALTR